jgi:hypothetical protein
MGPGARMKGVGTWPANTKVNWRVRAPLDAIWMLASTQRRSQWASIPLTC